MLSKPSDFVDKGDLCREHGIAGVLDHLRRFNIHEHQWVGLADVGLIQLAEEFAAPLIVHAADHAVGLLEVADRVAFAEELGVVGNAERLAGDACDDLADLAGGAHRDGGLDDDDRVLDRAVARLDCVADVVGDGHDSREIAASIRPRRGAHADEDEFAVGITGGSVVGEVQASGLDVERHEFAQPWLEDRALAPQHGGDPFWIDVQARYLVSGVGKTRASNKSDVSAADDGQVHLSLDPVQGAGVGGPTIAREPRIVSAVRSRFISMSARIKKCRRPIQGPANAF